MNSIKVLYEDSKGEMIVKVGSNIYYVDVCMNWDESVFEGGSVEENCKFLEEGDWILIKELKNKI